MKLKDLIVKTRLYNNNQYSAKINNSKQFQTEDYIYLYSTDDIKRLSINERICYPTDYALANSCWQLAKNVGFKDRKCCETMLRTTNCEELTIYDEELNTDFCDETEISIRPMMQIDASKVISIIKSYGNVFNIKPFIIKNKVEYHTMEFGSFPSTFVGNKLNDKLNELINNSQLESTGKVYFNEGVEFIYDNKKYVRLQNKCNFDNAINCKDKYIWLEVKPITWIITNWNSLPSEINLSSNESSTTIELLSEDGLFSNSPFYPTLSEKYLLWQNSLVRAKLNGYDIFEELSNGNGDKSLHAQQNFNYKNQGFIDIAFDDNINIITNQISKNDEIFESQTTNKKTLIEQNRDKLIKNLIKKRQNHIKESENQDENII